MKQTEIDELVAAWQEYFKTLNDWKILTENIEPKATGCGPVYELGNLIDRPNHSVAIADMRDVEFATPHYHKDETEIYFVLEGSGQVVVGGEVKQLDKGMVIVTPPNTAHFVIPKAGLVLAVVNTPPFNPANNIDLSESEAEVWYDREQFKRLTI